jgi:hypothetical protein
MLAAGSACAVEERPSVEPRADQIFRRMSDYLAQQRSFRVDAVTIDEVVTTEGQKLQFVTASQVAVRRPNALRTDRRGPADDTIVRYDGKRFTVYSKRTGYYAVTAAPPTIDAAIDMARAQYGIEAPAADLLLSDPYTIMMEDVETGRYLGVESIDGVACHHLAFTGASSDWQIWIQDGAQPVPRRLVITSKDQPNHPEFTVSLSNWQLSAKLGDKVFAFAPPPGARRIEMVGIAGRRGTL